ncbi:hypothetical protein A0O32_0388 [Anoxybacillus flavithermus]|nr:hypothetical protein A0O32_0388 [Anoxybacillus flavithermus]
MINHAGNPCFQAWGGMSFFCLFVASYANEKNVADKRRNIFKSK